MGYAKLGRLPELLTILAWPKTGMVLLLIHCFFNTQKIIYHKIKKVEKISFFIGSADYELKNWSKQQMKSGDLVLGYIIDSVGSVAIEAAIGNIHDNFEDSLKKKNMFVTNRFSPGYCGWDVVEQHKLFSFCPDKCAINIPWKIVYIKKTNVKNLAVNESTKYLHLNFIHKQALGYMALNMS